MNTTSTYERGLMVNEVSPAKTKTLGDLFPYGRQSYQPDTTVIKKTKTQSQTS